MKNASNFVAALLVCACLACSRAPAPKGEWNVYKGERRVMVLKDQPGPLISVALPPPGFKPPQFPFSGYSRDPMEEDALRRIAEKSADVKQFMAGLSAAGYRVEPAK